MKRTFLALITLFFMCNYAYSSEKDNVFLDKSLCMEEEVVDFYCTLENEKVVSVCTGTSEGFKYSKYRYGTQDNIELEFPDNIKDKDQKIYYIDLAGGSVTKADHLFFNINRYRYDIWVSDSSYSGIGVHERKKWNNKRIFSSICNVSEDMYDLYKKHGTGSHWSDSFPTNHELY